MSDDTQDGNGASRAFRAFLAEGRPLSPARAAIVAQARVSEALCTPPLIAQAALSEPESQLVRRLATALVRDMRSRSGKNGLAADLFVEFGLSSHEGVALMCLAEALLRVPDEATRDELIRDKIAQGDWGSHIGHARSLFVNAAAWALVTGKFVATADQPSFSRALNRLIRIGGEPIVRAGMDFVMRLLSERFVIGQTIETALARSRSAQARGYRHSFDMLGEAALTRAEADRFFWAYADAIRSLGSATGRGLYENPGVSIKLSALHPRYVRSQRSRLMRELVPRLNELAEMARAANIGVNIDAEESDRLDLSLDCFEALCANPRLAGWDGLGFVVQAYQKRAPLVIDHLISLARANGRRFMLRLVKGAYWDSEIKRAQIDGVDFPVFTRKEHTDVCYLACARRLLGAGDAAFPQFATHNAQTAAAVYAMAGRPSRPDEFEYQCLFGMGEVLYDAAMRPDRLARPCRIYAPVGAHEALLPYLVRRLLENGASASFVRRLADPSVRTESLTSDPVADARRIAPEGAPNPAIRSARDLFGSARRNSQGCDLADEATIPNFARSLADVAADLFASGRPAAPGPLPRAIVDPASDEVLGYAKDAGAADVAAAVEKAAEFAPNWAAVPARERARMLALASDLVERDRDRLVALIVKEAGRTIADAVAETREAVDFLRYYAAEAANWPERSQRAPLGVIASVSPWNFPLSIFTGQAAAALVCGNCVIAKPAEQTPLVARECVRILREAGIAPQALTLVTGDGATGAALVADPRIAGVAFTGSMQAARSIQRVLSRRLGAGGRPIPLVAETGGLNAMVVDSSALPQQVAQDALASAFNSAGQRCSSLRVLCLQHEIADKVLEILTPAMLDLVVGPPDQLSTDIGPLIGAEALGAVHAHLDRMRRLGRRVVQGEPPSSCSTGFYVSPALVEIGDVQDIGGEIFGPILHVLRYERARVDAILDAIEASEYGLTFAVHSRVDSFVDKILARGVAGNRYVNRNMIGAVVGVQPFGGHGLSGTGPKAGGPLYLSRLLAAAPAFERIDARCANRIAEEWRIWLAKFASRDAIERFDAFRARSPLGETRMLPGPDGESNRWELRSRGNVLCVASNQSALIDLISAALSAGGAVLVPKELIGLIGSPPERLVSSCGRLDLAQSRAAIDVALFEGSDRDLLALAAALAERPGPIVSIHRVENPDEIALEWLLREYATSVNTAANGGAVELMAP